MKQIIKNQENIEKINEERTKLSSRINESLNDNRTGLIDNMDFILQPDLNDNKNETIEKAKEIIIDLTEQIVTTTNVDEIIKIRKRINYYINKIKKILNERGVTTSELELLNSSTTDLRQSISRNLRFLKREHNLTEINCLYSNYDNLEREDKKKLTRLIRNELNFVKRNSDEALLNKKLNTIFFEIPSANKKKEENEIPDEFTISFETINDEDNTNIEETFDDNIIIPENPEETFKCKFLDEFSVKDYEQRFAEFIVMYRISKLHGLNKTMPKNLISFFKNIPKYIYNNKKIKTMIKDYERIYHNNDLYLFIKYIEEKNSIKKALEKVFKSTSLSDKEELGKKDYSAWLNDNFSDSYALERTI